MQRDLSTSKRRIHLAETAIVGGLALTLASGFAPSFADVSNLNGIGLQHAYASSAIKAKKHVIDLDYYIIELEDDTFIATGKSLNPEFQVVRNNNDDDLPEELPTKAFSAVYQKVTWDSATNDFTYETVAEVKEPGDYRVLVTGNKAAGYKGTIEEDFTVYAKNDLALADITFKGGGDDDEKVFAYTGKSVHPDITVKLDKRTLKEGTDYTAKYYKEDLKTDTGWTEADPVEDGNYAIEIIGKGQYIGSQQLEYVIYDSHYLRHFDLTTADDDYSVRYAYTGKPLVLQTKVIDVNDSVVPAQNYTIVYQRYSKTKGSYETIDGLPIEPGTYIAFAQAKNGSAYRGESDEMTISIYKDTHAAVTINWSYIDSGDVNDAVIAAGTSKETAKSFTVGKKVTYIDAYTFENCKAKTLTVKTKKLTKKSTKNCLKGSSFTTVKINVGKANENKKYVKKYQKVFAKSNSGKQVKVIAAK